MSEVSFPFIVLLIKSQKSQTTHLFVEIVAVGMSLFCIIKMILFFSV